MSTTTNNTAQTDQQIRNQTLNLELTALRAQCEAIHSLDTEHAFGIENTWSARVILRQVEKLVAACVELEGNMPADNTKALAEVEKFTASAEELKSSARFFNDQANVNAQRRKQHAQEEPGAAAGGETAQVVVGASESCCKAEIREFESFALQVSAIANLCTEMLYNSINGAEQTK